MKKFQPSVYQYIWKKNRTLVLKIRGEKKFLLICVHFSPLNVFYVLYVDVQGCRNKALTLLSVAVGLDRDVQTNDSLELTGSCICDNREARMKGVLLRWWQPRHNGTGHDQWALDHVEVVLWVSASPHPTPSQKFLHWNSSSMARVLSSVRTIVAQGNLWVFANVLPWVQPSAVHSATK